MAVHIYGLPVDMDPVIALARKHALFIIEDAAEQHGQTYKGRPVGSLGDIATVSFYPNKQITTGEGGMVVTNDQALADRCRAMRNLCFDKERRYIHEELGWNFRMSNVQAAIGVAQLERIDQIIAKKRQIGRWYQQRLRGIPGSNFRLNGRNTPKTSIGFLGLCSIKTVPFDASEVIRRLRNKGVDCRHFFWPLHEQPVFRKKGSGLSTSIAPMLNVLRAVDFICRVGSG